MLEESFLSTRVGSAPDGRAPVRLQAGVGVGQAHRPARGSCLLPHRDRRLYKQTNRTRG